MIALDPIFNDLSTVPLAESPFKAGDRINGLLKLLAEAPDHGLGGGLRIPEDFYLTEIADGFSLLAWLDHHETPHDQREFLLTLSTSTPFMKGSAEALQERAKLGECSFEGKCSQALQAAHLMGLPLVSFNHGFWRQSILEATVEEMDDGDEVTTENVPLVNLSESEHFSDHAGWIEERKKEMFFEPALLWEKRGEIFPDLDLCPHTGPALLALPVRGEMFPQVRKRLFDMQRVAELGRPFDKNGFGSKCKPSSASTLDAYKVEYSFKATNGDSILCPWHFDLPNGNRLYFGVRGKIYVVGHIGAHLPTRLFP